MENETWDKRVEWVEAKAYESRLLFLKAEALTKKHLDKLYEDVLVSADVYIIVN